VKQVSVTASILLAAALAVPAAGPAQARATAVSVRAGSDASRATVSWQPDPHRAERLGYRVCRDGEDSDGGGTYCADLPASARSFEFTRLLPATTYRFSVRERGTSQTATTSYRTASPAAAPELAVTLISDVRNSRQPYAPYDSVGYGYNQGGYDCQLYYHEYAVTEGCGGAWLTAELRGFRSFPDAAQITGQGRMSADFGRTFGCLVDGEFVPELVLREDDVEVPAVYLSASFGPGAVDGTRLAFFRNFQPVDFSCADGVRAQLGLRVSDVRVTITSDQIGTTRKTFAGPFYSPAT
jgi:hypothetical protein